jgi:hypothetical protein
VKFNMDPRLASVIQGHSVNELETKSGVCAVDIVLYLLPDLLLTNASVVLSTMRSATESSCSRRCFSSWENFMLEGRNRVINHITLEKTGNSKLLSDTF